MPDSPQLKRLDRVAYTDEFASHPRNADCVGKEGQVMLLPDDPANPCPSYCVVQFGGQESYCLPHILTVVQPALPFF